MARGDCNITNICIPTRRIIYSAGFTPPAPPPVTCNFPEGSFAQGGAICDWGYRVRWDIDPAQVPSDQTNYLAYISLTELVGDLSPGDNALFWNDANRAEFRVTTSDGATEIPHYTSALDTVNETGYIWALVPNVSSSVTTSLFIYLANPAATEYAVGNALGRNATFTGAGMVVAYDFEQNPAGASPQLTDLTGGGADGTATNSPTKIAGALGSAWRFVRTSSQYVTMGNLLNLDTSENLSHHVIIRVGSATPEGISDANAGRFIDKRGTGLAGTTRGYMARVNRDGTTAYLTGVLTDDGVGFLGSTGATATYPIGTTDSWISVALTFLRSSSPGQLKQYADGAQVGSTINSANGLGDANNIQPYRIGAASNSVTQIFDGALSWMAQRRVVASANLVLTEHNNQSAPGTFATFTNFLANPA